MREVIHCTEEQQRDCPLKRHFYNTHHKMWPASDYKSPLQYTFRELDANKVLMCTYEHVQLHKNERPPTMPNTRIMLEAITSVEE